MITDRWAESYLTIAIVALGLALLFNAPHFFAYDNINDLLINMSVLAIVAVGMTAVILTGHIDISVGSILAICATVAGIIAKMDVPLPLVVLATLATGAALGMINGLLVVAFNVHSVVITLGTMSIFRGLLLYLTGGIWIVDLPQSFLELAQGKMLGIPNPIIILFVIYAVFIFVFAMTQWGRSLYALGANREAARLSGVNTGLIYISTFVLSGALTGLSALLLASKFNVIQGNLGQGFEFQVITAVIIGGVSISGGVGSLLAVLLGAFFVTAAASALIFFHVSGLWTTAINGVLMLAAVTLSIFRPGSGMTLGKRFGNKAGAGSRTGAKGGIASR